MSTARRLSNISSHYRVEWMRPDEYRPALLDALEALREIAEFADCEPTEASIIEAFQDKQGEVDDLTSQLEEADPGGARLEEALQAKAELEEKINALRDDLSSATRERDEARAMLTEKAPLLDAFSDSLAMARRFVAQAETAQVKPRHVRKARSA